MKKLRLRFTKQGKVRFAGHRDVARLFERTIRKVGLPTAYSEGFSPRMRVSFGLALPTCYESEAEFLDILLDEEALIEGLDDDGQPGDECEIGGAGPALGQRLALNELAQRLTEALPVGFEVTAIQLLDRSGPSLQQVISACTWRFEIDGLDLDAATMAVDRVLSAEEVVVQRMKKRKPVSDDVRPAIQTLEVVGSGTRGAVFVTRLSCTPRVVRPAELVEALAPGHELAIASRTHQWIEHDGDLSEPLAAASNCAPHAMVRAS